MVKSKESFPEGYPINIENLNVCQGVSLTLLQYLLNVKYSTETEIDNECTTEIKVEKRKLDLHMEEDDTDDDVIENDSSDNKFHNENSISDMKSSRDEIFDEIKISNASIESIITLIKKQTIEISSLSKQNLKEENPFERMLSINPILKLARKCFYEGQVRVMTLQLYVFIFSCLSLFFFFFFFSLPISHYFYLSPSLSFSLFFSHSVVNLSAISRFCIWRICSIPRKSSFLPVAS